MFKNNFVLAIKVDGKILKDVKDLVYLPFGTEYSILLKNLEARTASVDVSIDGKDVLDGNSLVIRPEKITELKGFMKEQIITNKFKFIEKTAKISEHRGDYVDDGMIRVEVTYEKEQTDKLNLIQSEIHHHHHYHNDGNKFMPDIVPWWQQPLVTYSSDGTGDFNANPSFTVSCSNDNVNVCSSQYYSSTDFKIDSVNSNTKGIIGSGVPPKQETLKPVNEDGITVNGTPIKQDFDYAYIGELEANSTVIVMRLKGRKADNNTKIEKPLLVKVSCSTCGTKCRNAKYCPECGTCLI